MKAYLLLPFCAFLAVSCSEDEPVEKVVDGDGEYIDLLEERLGSMEESLVRLTRQLEEAEKREHEVVALPEETPEPEPVVVIPEEKKPTRNTRLPDEEKMALEKSRRAVRMEAQGEELGTVHTLDGRTLHDVRITRVTDVGLEVWHRDGTARLRFDGLPGDYGSRFFYVPELALKALQLERLAELERSRRIRDAAVSQLRAETRRREAALAKRVSELEDSRNEMVGGGFVGVVNQPQVVNQPPVVINEPYCPPNETVVVQRPVVVVNRPQTPAYCPPVVVTPQRPRPTSRPTTFPTPKPRPTVTPQKPPRPTVVTPAPRPVPVYTRPTPAQGNRGGGSPQPLPKSFRK
ncbi:MAG: hypothetical protein ACSHYF_12150 [Verrucomicrobiaceae bacterium]